MSEVLVEAVSKDRRIAGGKPVSFRASKGEAILLQGQSGAGKTTLLDLIWGAEVPSTGCVVLGIGAHVLRNPRRLFGGPALRPETAARLGVGRSTQQPEVFPDISIGQTFALVRERLKRRDAWCEQQNVLLADLYDLLPSAGVGEKSLGKSLSHGQKKMINLGVAFLVGREIILLDEPFGGLAEVLCERIGGLITRLVSEGVCAIVGEHIRTDLLQCTKTIAL